MDAMRSICVIYIVGFWHLDDYFSVQIQNITVNNFTYQTTYCVLAAFTLLSGFFASGNHIDNFKDAIVFYKKKILRLYPLYILACVLFVLYGFCPIGSLPVWLFGLGEFIRPFPPTLWFMCMIFVFDFLTPFLIKLSRMKKQLLFSLIIEILFWIFHELLGIDIRLAYYWPFFCLGLIGGYKDWHLQLGKSIRYEVFSLVVYIVLSFSLAKQFVLLTYICAVAFVYSLSGILIHLIRNERNKFIEFISYASMCAYLFHRVIYTIIGNTWGAFSVMKAYFLYLPLVFVTSWCIQYAYDKLYSCILRKRLITSFSDDAK